MAVSGFGRRIALWYSNLTPTTTTWLSISFIIIVGAWRHYDTDTHHNPFQQEVWIEWLSWVIIFAARKVTGPHPDADTSIPRTQSFWNSRVATWLSVAACVASQLLSSQRNLTWALPLTTIAVTWLSRYLPSSPIGEEGRKEVENSSFDSSVDGQSQSENGGGLASKLYIPTVFNLVCCVLLANYKETITNRMSLLDNLLFTISRSAAILLVSRLGQSESPDSIDRTNEENPTNTTLPTGHYLEVLSIPMLALLTLILVIVRPDLEMSSIGVLSHASFQALWWVAVINLLRQQRTNTVANLDTVSLSTQLAGTGEDIASIAMAVVALLISILQSIFVARPGAAARKNMYIFAGLFVLGLWIHDDPRLNVQWSAWKGFQSDLFLGHPIESLITTNRNHFAALVSKQSKNVKQAVKEYERRYRRKPPPGFDAWYQLAQDNKFVLPDEFDTFMNSLEPFYGVDPFVLQARLNKTLERERGRMIVVEIKNGNVTEPENADISILNTEWLNLVPYPLTIALNVWDESMVCVTWEEIDQALDNAKHPELLAGTTKHTNANSLIETGKQNGWAATSHACSVTSPSRQWDCPKRDLTTPLSFIGNATKRMDVCQNCELLDLEGLLVSPGNMKVAHELTPIWSASKPTHFNDILYPSTYYHGTRGDYRSKLDSHWEDKDNKFYWTGSSTGGWSAENTWDKMQRQRLVLHTQNTSDEAVQYLQETAPGSNKWQPRLSTMKEVANLFTTRITNVVQCDEAICEKQKEVFGLNNDRPQDPQDEAYKHRFVLDIDGNGFSGRYYRLLRSRSVVIKHTILQEWHDDRLIPWVHFVPLSSDYHELPEMVRFLTTERGLELSERIAYESTQWYEKALRDVDLQLVFLRMLLEYGRLLYP